MHFVLLRFTFIVIWLRGIPRVWVRTRKPAIISKKVIGKKRRHCSVSLAPSGMTLYCFFLSWELLDDPSQSSLCGCCQSTCRSRSRRGLTWGIPCSCSFLFLFLHFNKKKLFFRFLQLQAQICVGTPDHSGSIWGSKHCAGCWSGMMMRYDPGDWN